MIRLIPALAALALAVVPCAAQDDMIPEPDGYRMQEFRGPVPASLEGGTMIDTETAHRLWEAGEAIFVDVFPQPPRPEGLPEGTIWNAPRRDTIPGGTWLPNVGFGAIEAERDAYFREHLAELTGGDAAHPLVFYCLADCWMSWNAAKRAIVEYGYSAVYWYPKGTDGWSAAGHDLQKVDAAE